MATSTSNGELSVQERLIKSALECFLRDDYHKVTTRQIAAAANTNISMIRYYFGNKEGLYEEMIRHTLGPLLDVLDGAVLSSVSGFAEYFNIYYDTMQDNPRFPALILKVLALKQGPGKRFIYQLLERGRTKAHERIRKLQERELLDPELDPDIVRVAFVSLAMMPMLLKDVFEEQSGRELGPEFFHQLAEFNGRLFSTSFSKVSRDTKS